MEALQSRNTHDLHSTVDQGRSSSPRASGTTPGTNGFETATSMEWSQTTSVSGSRKKYPSSDGTWRCSRGDVYPIKPPFGVPLSPVNESPLQPHREPRCCLRLPMLPSLARAGGRRRFRWVAAPSFTPASRASGRCLLPQTRSKVRDWHIDDMPPDSTPISGNGSFEDGRRDRDGRFGGFGG